LGSAGTIPAKDFNIDLVIYFYLDVLDDGNMEPEMDLMVMMIVLLVVM